MRRAARTTLVVRMLQTALTVLMASKAPTDFLPLTPEIWSPMKHARPLKALALQIGHQIAEHLIVKVLMALKDQTSSRIEKVPMAPKLEMVECLKMVQTAEKQKTEECSRVRTVRTVHWREHQEVEQALLVGTADAERLQEVKVWHQPERRAVCLKPATVLTVLTPRT